MSYFSDKYKKSYRHQEQGKRALQAFGIFIGGSIILTFLSLPENIHKIAMFALFVFAGFRYLKFIISAAKTRSVTGKQVHKAPDSQGDYPQTYR